MDTPSDLFEKLDDDLRSAVSDLGWTSPMPVQSKVIPLMRGDRDLIVQAQTGSGKTHTMFGPPTLRSDRDKGARRPSSSWLCVSVRRGLRAPPR